MVTSKWDVQMTAVMLMNVFSIQTYVAMVTVSTFKEVIVVIAMRALSLVMTTNSA